MLLFNVFFFFQTNESPIILCAQGDFQIKLQSPKRKSILCTVALKSLKALDILSLLKTEKVTSFLSRRVLYHTRWHDYDTSLSAQGCVLTRYLSLKFDSNHFVGCLEILVVVKEKMYSHSYFNEYFMKPQVHRMNVRDPSNIYYVSKTTG